MSLFAPSYYASFRCIAGDCRHSCCIGWEIDIDPDTLTRYNALPPRERKAILSHTATEKGCTSFRLTADERCPFLTSDGLCRLILSHGEGILCDICREHPRFYNSFSDRTEVGLGLCCEAAAELILTHPEPFGLVCIENDTSDENGVTDPFEADFFSERSDVFRILCDRTLPLSARINRLTKRYSLSLAAIYESDRRWQRVYRNLERLDPAWDDALTAWERASLPASGIADPIFESAAEQLIAYFLYRHLADAICDGRYPERVAFALLSTHVICSVAAARSGTPDPDTLIDTARAYSAEVEYDEENVDAILCELGSSPIPCPGYPIA
ncbi:MAG: flagellin lysine-N-methylase [Clostridia bacterium]|nr:flagellin lysine-N-methylase [Clostridia bacterium]